MVGKWFGELAREIGKRIRRVQAGRKEHRFSPPEVFVRSIAEAAAPHTGMGLRAFCHIFPKCPANMARLAQKCRSGCFSSCAELVFSQSDVASSRD
jgi:hypothetical protein